MLSPNNTPIREEEEEKERKRRNKKNLEGEDSMGKGKDIVEK